MISTDRAASPLPWLAAAVVFLYIALLVLRFTLPPAKVDVEVLARPAASANGLNKTPAEVILLDVQGA